MLYSGVGLSLIATVVGVICSIRHDGPLTRSFSNYNKIPNQLKLIALGCQVEVFPGQFDNWWHTNSGFDGLLSPTHLMLISGMLLSDNWCTIWNPLGSNLIKIQVNI